MKRSATDMLTGYPDPTAPDFLQLDPSAESHGQKRKAEHELSGTLGKTPRVAAGVESHGQKRKPEDELPGVSAKIPRGTGFIFGPEHVRLEPCMHYLPKAYMERRMLTMPSCPVCLRRVDRLQDCRP